LPCSPRRAAATTTTLHTRPPGCATGIGLVTRHTESAYTGGMRRPPSGRAGRADADTFSGEPPLTSGPARRATVTRRAERRRRKLLVDAGRLTGELAQPGGVDAIVVVHERRSVRGVVDLRGDAGDDADGGHAHLERADR